MQESNKKETKVIYCYALIVDMQEGKKYYCCPEMIAFIYDQKKCYINPYGRASLGYEQEEDLIFPIQKQNDKIILVETKERLTPYHSSEPIQDKIKGWLEVDLTDYVIKTVHSEEDINGTDFTYNHMGLLELENHLADWYDVISGNDTENPMGVDDVKKIIDLLKEKISKATDKSDLMKLFNNLSSLIDDYDDERFTSITNELFEDCRERLITLGKKKGVQKNDKWKDMKDEELQNIYIDITSSEEDIRSAENELKRRQSKNGQRNTHIQHGVIAPCFFIK